MSWERDLPFTARLWKKFDDYLKKYRVDGTELEANPPNSISYYNKLPDIVVTDKLGTPQLIVETKRKADDGYMDLYDPLGKAPIAQALCYATLALEHHNLDRTPLFATANERVIVVFRGVEREKVKELVDVNICRERHPTPDDWIRALRPGAYGTLLQRYIIDRLENPLSDDAVRKLFEYVGKWVNRTPITPVHLYRILVGELKQQIEELHDEYVEDAVKMRILNDPGYFEKLYREALARGYESLLSPGLFSLCPNEEWSVIKNVCEPLAEEISKRVSEAKTPHELFSKLRDIASMVVNEIVEYCRREGPSQGSPPPPPICNKTVIELLSFRNLSRMMAYVFIIKILAYKLLELHYDIPSLRPLSNVNDPNDISRVLQELFLSASRKIEEILGIRDFRPIFETGLYDLIVFRGLEAVRKVNALIETADAIKESLRHLPGVVGYVYEGFIPPAERHRLGQFYTPPAVARLITRWSIRSKDDLILDGGCGSGTFLIEAYKRLLLLKYNKEYGQSYPSCGENFNEHQEIVNRLYGVDINTFATQLTSLHLMLMEPRCPISSLNVIPADFFSINTESKTTRYDAVIGNPPYTRWVEIPDSTKELIRKSVGVLARAYDLVADIRRGREPGIYVYWIMHAAKNLLKDNGRLGMIISNMWLQTDYGIDFGRFLLDNFRVKALIDISYRLFEALISTVIILAEKEPNREARNNNTVLLVRVPPIDSRLSDKEVEKTLDESLRCIENSITATYDFNETTLRECRKNHGIWYGFIKQSEIPRNMKWISLFFEKVEDIVKMLETHPLVIKAGEWFKPSRGNSIYSIWALDHGRRPDLGAKDFFYFSRDKTENWDRNIEGFREAVERYLVPAITASRYVRTFKFAREDWERIRDMERRVRGRGVHPGNAWMLVLHERMERLPQLVQEYIRWGETDCRTRIRATRGGGRRCSEAEACRARERAGEPYFYGWYDLGGYIPTPIMTVYQPRYHPRFFLVKIPNIITYHAIITLIPRVRISISNSTYDPIEYNRVYGNIIDCVKPNIELDEVEVMALLAYLNSTFNWLWLEQNARYIAKGPLGLEVNVVERMPILDVKKIDRGYVEELAQLFDKLESTARSIIGTNTSSSEEGESEEEEEGSVQLRMFRDLKPVFREIDSRITEILGIHVDVDELWRHAWEMMERRIKGAKRKVRPGVEVEIREENRRSKESSSHIPLTKWFKPGGG